ncbi:drug/metabolite transporter (DMT)-like permease [Janthinobacterium sp. CG_23.3]|uniref:DMT family transporter n=1 Tax=Janthinobacterium sp. CG_23.3 TaxID=3349634 RepID=UPI0038D49F3C
MQKDYARGALCCFVATVAWGGMFPVMDDALTRIDAFQFTAIRYSVAGLAFLALLLMREGPGALSLKGERYWLAWLLGSAGFAGFGFLVFLGQQLAGREGTLSAAVIMATMPMLALLVNWIVRRTRPPLFSFAFIGLSFLGVVLVITDGQPQRLLREYANYRSNALLLLGALCWVVYTVGASLFAHWSPYRYTTMTTLLGLSTVFTVVIALRAAGLIHPVSASVVVSIAPHLGYMIFLAGFVAVLAWNIGNSIITPMNGVLFMDVVPLTAFIVSAAGGTPPRGGQMVGAALTASALVLNNIFQRRRMAAQDARAALRKLVPLALNEKPLPS